MTKTQKRYKHKLNGGFFNVFAKKPVASSTECDVNNLSSISKDMGDGQDPLVKMHSNYQKCCPKDYLGRLNSSPYCKQLKMNFDTQTKYNNDIAGYYGNETNVAKIKESMNENPIQKTKKSFWKFGGVRRRKTHSKKRNNTKTKKHNKKQRIYKMIGCNNGKTNNKTNKSCSNCGPNCHCIDCKCAKGCPGNCYLGRRISRGGDSPIAPLSWSKMQQFGGNCEQCSLSAQQNGGAHMSIPGPFVGQPWSINALPGQNGIANDNNYLASYKDVVANDPSYHQRMDDSGFNTINSKVGGYTYKHKNELKSSKSNNSVSRGGGLIPQDLVNIGRDFMYNVNSAYNAFNGYKAPVNPLPYVQNPSV